MVVYDSRMAQLSVLPPTIRAIVEGYSTLSQVVKYVRKTQWFLSKAVSVRNQILASLSSSQASRPKTQSSGSGPRSYGITTSKPSLGRGGSVTGSITVKHREYITDVTASASTFNIRAYNINPSDFSIFTWLPNISRAFERYRFKSLLFSYVPNCTNNDRGRVILGCDYDATDAAPSDKTELYSYEGTSETSVWSRATLRMRPSGWLLTTPPPNAPSPDMKPYYYGQLFVATNGTSYSGSQGELFVEYEVELDIAQRPAPAAHSSAWANSAATHLFTSNTNSGGEQLWTVITNGMRFRAAGLFQVTIMISAAVSTTTNNTGSTATVMTRNEVSHSNGCTCVLIVRVPNSLTSGLADLIINPSPAVTGTTVVYVTMLPNNF